MTTFSASDSWIPAQLRKPVREALESGWLPAKGRTKSGGWWIYSPKKTQKFYVPITCKSPDIVAKKLRELITKAYLAERSSFVQGHGDGGADTPQMMEMVEGIIADGVRIIPGSDMQMECPVCEVSFMSWEAFAAHQEGCLAKEAARNAEEQAKGQPAETVPDLTEPAQSGTIGTKEETPVATESTTPTPAPKPGPKASRKKGYTWTVVKGKENPLHEVLYEACRYTRRFKNETDSKYSLRLAQYIEEQDLLSRLAFADPDMQATALLEQIREIVGAGEPEDNEEAEQLKKDAAEKDEQITALTAKVGELRGLIRSLSELASEEADK